jgi:hypothetical protein
VRGGCWDARTAIEEIAIIVRNWRDGDLGAVQALEEILLALYANNFGPLLDGAEEKGEVGDEQH